MEYKTKRRIVRTLQAARARRQLRKVTFKKGAVSLFDVLATLFKKMWDDDVLDRAAGVAFSFTIAIFPAIIFLFTLIPYIHELIPEIDNTSILEFLHQWIPENMYAVIETTIVDIVSKSRGGLLTLGAVFALFLASNGTMALMNAFNSIYKTKDNRTWIKQRFIATGLTIMLAISLIVASILLIAGQVAIEMIDNLVITVDELPFNLDRLLVLRFFVLLIIFGLATSSLFYFAPAVHDKWRFFSVGALFTTLSSLGISYVFGYYVANFATYNKLYGSIGVMIAMMVWLYIISIVLLIGYEINASIHQVEQASTNGKKTEATPVTV